MKRQIATLLYVTGVLLIFGANLRAQDYPSAEDIAYKVFHRDDGEDSYFKIEMTLKDKRDNQRKRILLTYSKDYGEVAKNFIRFLSPADIEGTGFLSWENQQADDTQYLYLPDLGRSKRIVSSQKDLRFVNTDFTYEDMQRRKLAKDSHCLLREEDYQGHSCYVLKYVPKDAKSSQYSKFIQWIDEESFVPIKVEYYDKKGQVCKQLSVARLEQVEGIWTAMDTLMEDFSGKHQTRMLISEAVYNQGLDDEVFALHNLEDY